jgi:hypothetical protein
MQACRELRSEVDGHTTFLCPETWQAHVCCAIPEPTNTRRQGLITFSKDASKRFADLPMFFKGGKNVNDFADYSNVNVSKHL